MSLGFLFLLVVDFIFNLRPIFLTASSGYPKMRSEGKITSPKSSFSRIICVHFDPHKLHCTEIIKFVHYNFLYNFR